MTEAALASAAAPMPTMPEHIDLPLQHRHEVRLLGDSLAADARTVEVVWSTGAPVRRSDPWTGRAYDEVLSLDPEHVDLTRLESGAPLLDSHAAYSLAGIIGVVERVWLADGADGPEARAVIRFSERAEVEPLWQDVRNRIIRHVSAGYRVRTYRIEEDADPPVWRAVDWQPVELSLVAVPADPGAGMRSDDPTNPCRLIRRLHSPRTETRAMNDSITVETRPHHIRVGDQDEVTTRRVAVESALLHRYDPGRHDLSEPAREWRGLSLIEMARSLLEAAGERVRGLARDEIATRALHSTSDFPQILAAVTGKTLRATYDAAPRTFMPIARRTSAADFKEIHRLQLGEAPQLEKVNQSGEFKRGSIAEGKESYRVETWGKVIGITRQVIVNDDLDAFTRVPALFGTSAATLESDIVWGIVLDNPAMADGNALFHASHKNLVGTGTALDVASLGKARTMMAKQTGLDGKTILNLRPTYLVVPSGLELTAEQLIAQSLVPAKTTDVVPNSIRSLAVIAEPRLDPAAGAVPWYLFANPATIDTIEYAYLEGQDGVAIESRMGFDVDGVEIRARLDFGAKAIDWRGMLKNAGVALT